eukprot:4428144-Amphidinium_carterae.1
MHGVLRLCRGVTSGPHFFPVPPENHPPNRAAQKRPVHNNELHFTTSSHRCDHYTVSTHTPWTSLTSACQPGTTPPHPINRHTMYISHHPVRTHPQQ